MLQCVKGQFLRFSRARIIALHHAKCCTHFNPTSDCVDNLKNGPNDCYGRMNPEIALGD